MHLHQHDDHFHVHEHFHGGKDNIMVTTIGLVIHSFADGVALGASLYLSGRSEENQRLGFIIFIATIMHKMPAAIGFGTFLAHEGFNKREAIKHILAFTLTSPISCILIFQSLELYD